jgi:molybdopterin-guanine dinucleotide biosynthesis protein B
MALVNTVIFQIVGFQDSGKTTFVKKLLHELCEVGVTAVTVKHHGHGGKPALIEDKDSVQHMNAGAIASLVEGDGRILIQAEKKAWTLDEKIKLLSIFEPDLILIEGHKYERFPKGVLIRKQEDVEILTSLENIQVVYYWDFSLLEKIQLGNDIPVFQINDPAGYEWLVNYFLAVQSD